jgi:AraC-like DNA-binding protein/mannose-6-phosphate isomerase-like protein (cupin superfamily)
VDKINRIDYKNSQFETQNFEINRIQSFFDQSIKKHMTQHYRINFWVMLYITEGHGSHLIDFKEYHYKKGDLLLIQKNHVQCFITNNIVKGFIIHINEPFLQYGEQSTKTNFLNFFDRPFDAPILPINVSTHTTNRQLIEIIYKEYTSVPNTNNLLLYTLFQSFIHSLKEYNTSRYHHSDLKSFAVYDTFRKLVEKHYTRIKTVEEYAYMMNLSKKVIDKSIQSIIGQTAKQYIIDRLLLEIKSYLIQGDLMNYEIADILGFDSPANMTKFFKRYEGISPKKFKEKATSL